MTPSNYRCLDGKISEFDLDAVVDVVSGWSDIKPGWQGFIVYLSHLDQFVELMSTVPDIRGNSEDQAVEVDASYVGSTYGLSPSQLAELRRSPSRWTFIKKR